MNDDIDALLREKRLGAPPGFAARLTALARATAQAPEQSRTFRPWLWVSASAAAGLGAVQLCEFVFVAFVAASAH
jgi:hypothetical protein